MGHVHYTVANLEPMVRFYHEVLGFQILRETAAEASLGAPEGELLRLTRVAGAQRAPGTTGLYHTAFLLPNRGHLAHLVQRIAATGTEMQGTAEHGTHLAIYLPDPEGNGIELAWDYPRERWPMRDGRLQFADMMRGAVDIPELLTEISSGQDAWDGLPAGTVVGHVHLHGNDLETARTFYQQVLGLAITADSEQFRAVFFSAGGYHHHLGVNLWQGPDAPAPPPDSVGLRSFSLQLPGADAVQAVVERCAQAGLAATTTADGVAVTDPSSIPVLLQTV